MIDLAGAETVRHQIRHAILLDQHDEMPMNGKLPYLVGAEIGSEGLQRWTAIKITVKEQSAENDRVGIVEDLHFGNAPGRPAVKKDIEVLSAQGLGQMRAELIQRRARLPRVQGSCAASQDEE